MRWLLNIFDLLFLVLLCLFKFLIHLLQHLHLLLLSLKKILQLTLFLFYLHLTLMLKQLILILSNVHWILIIVGIVKTSQRDILNTSCIWSWNLWLRKLKLSSWTSILLRQGISWERPNLAWLKHLFYREWRHYLWLCQNFFPFENYILHCFIYPEYILSILYFISFFRQSRL